MLPTILTPPPPPRPVASLPDWVHELPAPSDHGREAADAAPELGWKSPGGAVVCRACCPKPAGAVPVTFVGEGDALRWEASAAETAEATPVDGGPPADGGADVDDVESDDDEALFPEGF